MIRSLQAVSLFHSFTSGIPELGYDRIFTGRESFPKRICDKYMTAALM